MTSRREFLAAASGIVATAPTFRWRMAPGATLLFQGDSITDAGRDRAIAAPNTASALGFGYPELLAGLLRDRYPARDLQVFNRGVSGNTVDDLRVRWDADTITMRPHVLSILIGVNDIWHTLMGNYHGTPEKYEAGYNELLGRTHTALPSVSVVVMEPFVLRVGAVDDKWFPAFDTYRAAARRVAKANHAIFVPLHDMFQGLAAKSTPAYWAADGVHPTLAGHAAIAERWMSRVKL